MADEYTPAWVVCPACNGCGVVLYHTHAEVDYMYNYHMLRCRRCVGLGIIDPHDEEYDDE